MPARNASTSWLQLRPASLPEGRPLVPRRKPIQEERAADQDEDWRSPGKRQQGAVARGVHPAKPTSGRLVCLLRLRNALAGLSGGRQPRLRPGTRIPVQAAQGARTWHAAVLRRTGLWRPRRAASSKRAYWTSAVCLTMKPVGKPDAGNPHVRFDERGRETELRRMAQATAPFLDSTRDLCEITTGHDRAAARVSAASRHGCASRALARSQLGSVGGTEGLGGAVADQPHNRAWARRNTAASGQLEAMAMRMRRTLRVTRAPIFKSFRRMLPQVAVASSVPARPMRRSAATST